MPPKKTLGPAPEETKKTKATATKATATKKQPEKKSPVKPDKALAKAESKAVSTDVNDLMAEMTGAGTDMFGTQDVQRPTIRLLQSNSPQIKKRGEKYVEGAEDGDIYVSGTGDLFSESIRIIVVGYSRNYVEFKSRDVGGGMVGAHPMNPATVEGMERGKGGAYIADDGNEFIDTMAYYVLYESPSGQWLPARLFFKSTMLTAGRELNTKLSRREIQTSKGVRPAPLFANIVTLEVITASNDQGVWNKFRVGDIDFIDDVELLQQAKREFEMFVASAKVDFRGSDDHEEDEQVDAEVVEDDDSHY